MCSKIYVQHNPCQIADHRLGHQIADHRLGHQIADPRLGHQIADPRLGLEFVRAFRSLSTSRSAPHNLPPDQTNAYLYLNMRVTLAGIMNISPTNVQRRGHISDICCDI